MTIEHSVPSSLRKPGEFHEFDITSAARGLVPLTDRVILMGGMSAAGDATADEPVQVFSEAEADARFGAGSEVALMVRKALEVGRRVGFQPQIWATGIADPAGTASAQTLTIAGTATEDGDLVVRIAGRWIRVGVSTGDDANTVAAALEAAIDAQAANLPVTAGVAGAVVTCTAVITGVNGEDIKYSVEQQPAGITCTPASSAAGVGVLTYATALTNSKARSYIGLAISSHTATEVTALDTHLDECWAPAAKLWRFAFLGENGTLSTANTLAAAANDYRYCVTTYEDSPSLPGEIAAAMATIRAARQAPNYNFDYSELPIYAPPDASVYTDAEIETALDSGTTPLAPDESGQTYIVRMITTQTTVGGAPFENTKDLANPYTMVYAARQLDARFVLFRGTNKSARVRKRMYSVAYSTLKELETLEYLQNVDDHAGELTVDDDPVVATRAVVSVPESVVPNLHQVVLVHVLYVE